VSEPQPMKIWIDGAIVDAAHARISVLDHGLLYGDGLFEGIRIAGGRVFRLGDHLRRFATGARAIGLALPHAIDEIEKIVLDTARAFGRPDAYVRLVVTRGVGALGIDPTGCTDPKLFCIVTALSLYPEDKQARGVDLVTVSLRRPAADALDPQIKSLNYMNNVLAKREAKIRGADEALLLNDRGLIAEAAAANIFVVRDDRLATPPPSDGALPGITRRSVLEIAAELGIPASERSLGRIDLLGADEAFLSGSGARIVRVASLDGQPIGEVGRGPGSVTSRIIGAFPDFAARVGVAF
jgi:branched-chain amino acid aminotransferase